MGSSFPESRFSEFEVVYDDGIRKQRTFSLTTELDDEELDSDDSDDDDNDTSSTDNNDTEGGTENSPLIGNYHNSTTYGTSPSFRPSIQNHPAFAGEESFPTASNRRYPSFTSENGGHPFACITNSLSAAWRRFSQYLIPLPNRRILKASLAYLLACLVTFIPFFTPYVGVSGHLAASSAVFFNPAKTLGRMVDAITAGLCAIGFAFLVSIGSLLSAVWFNTRDMYILGHVVSVVVFGGGSTFIIAYAKAYYNRPTVNVACILSHIMIMVILTKEGTLTLSEFTMTRALAIATSMLLGVLITTLVSIFVWPESAHEKLRQDMGKSLTSFRLLLKLLTKTFLLEADTTPFGSESVQKLIESQVKSFSALTNSLQEAKLEFPRSGMNKYEDCVKSLTTLAQYLNGLRSSCGLQYDMLKRDEQRKDDARSGPKGSPGPRRPETRMSSYSLIGGLNADQDQSASADLIEFLDHIGKPMKSLALTCKLTIEHLQDIFTSTDPSRPPKLGRSTSRTRSSFGHRHGQESVDMLPESHHDHAARNHSTLHSMKGDPTFDHMHFNLAKALDIFEAANSKALKRFYAQQNKRRSSTIKRPTGIPQMMSDPSLADIMSDMPDLAAGLGSQKYPGMTAEDPFADKAPVGEQIFLVYFFVFNLMEFSKELSNLVNCVDSLVDGDDGLPFWIARNRQSWWRRIWFSLTGFPRRLRRPEPTDVFANFDDSESGVHSGNNGASYQWHTPTSRSGSNQQQPTAYGSTTISSTTGFRRKREPRLFPKPNIHNTKNTLQTPIPQTFAQRWSTRLWKFLHVFRSFQVKFAAKAAISTMVLLIPAFVDVTRPYFVKYRGEWALISMLVVMVPTVGGTNIVGLYRILGTVLGCYVGVLVYIMFPADHLMLPLSCFIVAIPCFYLILCSGYPRIGQVSLLAFNLVVIQTFNRRNGDGTVPPDGEDDDDDMLPQLFSPLTSAPRSLGFLFGHPTLDPDHVAAVWTIAFHRAVAVSVGVIIGILVTSYIWPYEARVELRKALSDLLLNISWLYNRLVSVYSTNLDRVSIIPPDESFQQNGKNDRSKFKEFVRRTTFQERFQTPYQELQPTSKTGLSGMDIERMNKEFMAIELSLQLQLLRLYALLEETPNEPRLKGKFPVGTYRHMLGCCQNILDRFLSMRLVITKDEWLESARRDFIVPVNKERREMVGNVLLYFYTIASALRLKTPLPPYLPPANAARLRLIRKIRQLPVVQNKVVMTEDNDDRYIFYYAYALVMEDVIRELERLGRWSQDLFGVITPASEFEAWFTDDGMVPTALPAHLPSSATREAPPRAYYDVDRPLGQHSTLRSEDRASVVVAMPPQEQQSRRQSPSSQRQFLSSSLKNHQHIPDESTGLLSSTKSNYRSVENPSHDHSQDEVFSFDPHDGFLVPADDDMVAPPSLRSSRRFQSSQSLQSLDSPDPSLHRQSQGPSNSSSSRSLASRNTK